MSEAIEIAARRGYLGDDIQGSRQAFDLEVRLGAGAYICGEETSLLESLEGKRGIVRASRRCRRSRASSASRRSSTTSVASPPCPIILAKGARVL